MEQFKEHLTSKQAKSLKTGDKIDFLDPIGDKAYPVEIIATRTDEVKIHYTGWSNHWDIWVSYEQEPYRFAKSNAITIPKPPEPRNRIKYITFDLRAKEQEQPPPSYAATTSNSIDVIAEDKDENDEDNVHALQFVSADDQTNLESDKDVPDKDVPTQFQFMFMSFEINLTDKQKRVCSAYHLIVHIIACIISLLALTMEYRYDDNPDTDMPRCGPLDGISFLGRICFVTSLLQIIAFFILVGCVKYCIKCISLDDDDEVGSCMECLGCLIGCAWFLFTQYGGYILSLFWWICNIILMVYLGKGMINGDKCSDIQIECAFLFVFEMLIPVSKLPAIGVWCLVSPNCEGSIESVVHFCCVE